MQSQYSLLPPPIYSFELRVGIQSFFSPPHFFVSEYPRCFVFVRFVSADCVGCRGNSQFELVFVGLAASYFEHFVCYCAQSGCFSDRFEYSVWRGSALGCFCLWLHLFPSASLLLLIF